MILEHFFLRALPAVMTRFHGITSMQLGAAIAQMCSDAERVFVLLRSR